MQLTWRASLKGVPSPGSGFSWDEGQRDRFGASVCGAVLGNKRAKGDMKPYTELSMPYHGDYCVSRCRCDGGC
eukprot:6207415-Pleurochrysis_carterae.AAC.2